MNNAICKHCNKPIHRTHWSTSPWSHGVGDNEIRCESITEAEPK